MDYSALSNLYNIIYTLFFIYATVAAILKGLIAMISKKINACRAVPADLSLTAARQRRASTWLGERRPRDGGEVKRMYLGAYRANGSPLAVGRHFFSTF